MNAKKSFTKELQSNSTSIRLHKSKFGTRCKLKTAHADEVDEALETKAKNKIRSTKDLYPQNHPKVKAVTSLLGDATRCWKLHTIRYRNGERLLLNNRLSHFEEEIEALQVELDQALEEMQESRDEILARAKNELGDKIFDVNDYPKDFRKSCKISWEVGNFKVPDELADLSPTVYAREKSRLDARFEAAVSVFEEECRDTLSDLVGSLLDKLNPQDGKKVVFREATATNLREFFDRFKSLQMTDDDELIKLVDEAEAALGSTTMGSLKRSKSKQNAISKKFEAVKEKLDQMIVDAPSRSIDLNDLED